MQAIVFHVSSGFGSPGIRLLQLGAERAEPLDRPPERLAHAGIDLDVAEILGVGDAQPPQVGDVAPGGSEVARERRQGGRDRADPGPPSPTA